MEWINNHLSLVFAELINKLNFLEDDVSITRLNPFEEVDAQGANPFGYPEYEADMEGSVCYCIGFMHDVTGWADLQEMEEMCVWAPSR